MARLEAQRTQCVAFVACSLFLWASLIPAQSRALDKSSDTYLATVTLLPCSKAGNGHLKVTASDWMDTRYKGTPIPVLSEKAVGNLLVVVLSLPRRHLDVWFDANGCEAKIGSMALGESERHYVAGLLRGFAADFGNRDAYIAGALPFAGVQRVELISADPGKADFSAAMVAVLNGPYYYFEGPPAGLYRIRIIFAGQTPTFTSPPFWTADRAHPTAPFGIIRNFALSDIEAALDSPDKK